jgi:hypothetical protein
VISTAQRARRLAEICFLLLALASLVYAVVTAPRRGIDLRLFQEGGRLWADGLFEIGRSRITLYPPFMLPLLAPLSLVSIDLLLIIFLALNLATTALVIHLSIKLWGAEWPL